MPYRYRFSRSRAVVAALGLAVLTTGCGGAQLEQMRGEIRVLREEVEELKRSQAATRVQYDDLRQRTVVLEDRSESERLDHGRKDSWIPKLPTVKVQPEAQQVAEAQADEAPQQGPSGPADDLPPQLQDNKPKGHPAAALYEQALALFRAGQMTAARGLFEKQHKQWPDHDLADNALYWMGETQFAQAQWLRAAQHYLRVIKEYPRGNKVPDAMYKLAVAYQKMGDLDGAADVLRQVMRLYPKTDAARLAGEDLSRLPALERTP